jgi:hypothetical protein
MNATHTAATSIRTDLTGRYDLYGPVHKGLRRAQADMLVRLGSADFGRDGASALLADLRGLLAIAASHLAHEEEHIHRALEARIPGASSRLEHQHEAHFPRFEGMERLVAAIEAAEPADRPALGRALYLSFAAYVAEDLEHMHEEETVTWPLLCAHFRDEELAAIEGAIVGSLSPQENMAFMRMMIPAMNPAERARLFAAIRQVAPPEAVAALLDHAARPTLSDQDYGRLVGTLGLAA